MALIRLIVNSTNRIISRNIRMSANMQEKAAEAIEKIKAENPYFEKYAQKIAKVQKISPEKLVARLEQQKEKEKKAESKARDYSELMNPKQKSVDVKKAGEIPYKKLEDIMKLELIEGRPVEEIKEIWIEYHRQKEAIAAAIPTTTFDTLMENAKKFPLFIFPIPRSQGYEFIMFQFAANTIHFTPLLCFQVHKENAPECLSIVHYTEFREQGIVLMRGEFDKKVLSPQEAQCLANQLQLYYTQNNPAKLKILETFTKSPENFKHMDVIKELENLQIA